MKEQIIEEIARITSIKREQISNMLASPPDESLGDYSLPCFELAKSEKKNPVIIAKELAQRANKKGFERIESNGPYLNFFIDKKILSRDTLNLILKQEDKYGSSKEGKGKRIIVDYSAPNVGKPMHVGHIRSTIIGDSMIKIKKFLGYKTIGINYLGDIGLHIGKLIVAYELWADKTALKKDPTKELLRLYVKFCEHEKTELVEGQDDNYEGNEWTDKAKEKLKLIELKDKKTISIWKEIEKYSLIGFDRIYSKLNVKFDDTSGQSNFSDSGKKEVQRAVKQGLAIKENDSEGVYVLLSAHPKKFILRSNGTASYITQDIGAAIYRFNKYKFNEMIYVTDYRQKAHFQQLFEILEKLGYSFTKNCVHLPFGTINFGNEILATRTGKVILLEEVVEKTVEKAEQEINKRNSNGDPLKIGISSLKYSILKVEPSKDVSFSWEQALSFEGDTGPYLLYTYARAKSILRKAGKNKANSKANKITSFEYKLIKLLSLFPEIVSKANSQLSPNLIANYSFQLSQAFNEFYHSNQVIGSEEEAFRLSLVKASAQVLKNALSLLGIETLEEM